MVVSGGSLVACSLDVTGLDADAGPAPSVDAAPDTTTVTDAGPDAADGHADAADATLDAADAHDTSPDRVDGADGAADTGNDATDAALDVDASDGAADVGTDGPSACPSGTVRCGSRCISGLSCDSCEVGIYLCSRTRECSTCETCPGDFSFGDFAGVGCYDVSSNRFHGCRVVPSGGVCSTAIGGRPTCDPLLGTVPCPASNQVCVADSTSAGSCRGCGEEGTEGMPCGAPDLVCQRQARGVGRCVPVPDGGASDAGDDARSGDDAGDGAGDDAGDDASDGG